MAKFAAMRQFERVNDRRASAMSSSVKPVVPTTAWMPCAASQGKVWRAAAMTVKSTTTSGEVAASASSEPAIVTPDRSAPAAWGSMAATSSRCGSSSTAAQTADPIRPPAPTTPTRIAMPSNVALSITHAARRSRRPAVWRLCGVPGALWRRQTPLWRIWAPDDPGGWRSAAGRRRGRSVGGGEIGAVAGCGGGIRRRRQRRRSAASGARHDVRSVGGGRGRLLHPQH